SDASGSGGDPGSGGSGVVSVTCAGTTCAPTEICCVVKQNDPTEQDCAVPMMCAGVAAQCDGPEDCPGEGCCGDFDNATQLYKSVTCKAACDGSPAQPIICHYPDGACPDGLHCADSSHMPAGFGLCR